MFYNVLSHFMGYLYGNYKKIQLPFCEFTEFSDVFMF